MSTALPPTGTETGPASRRDLPLSPAPQPGQPPPRIRRTHVAVILAIAVTWFLIGNGAVWKHPYDYVALARSIGWSYLPIPFLVLFSLLLTRRLRLVTWIVETLTVAALKFVITATFMCVVWSLAGPPPPGGGRQADPKPAWPELLAAPKPAAPPRPSADAVGRVRGTVTDGSGAPAAGVLVVIEGLSSWSFEPRADPVIVEDDGSGVVPSVSAVQAGEPLVLRSLDGRMHALMGMRERGGTAFNHPMLPIGQERAIALPPGLGEVAVHCTAHPGERPGVLFVLDHPFWTRTGPDGSFSFDGVPAGDVVVLVRDATGMAAREALRVPAHGVARSSLELRSGR